jgi:AraC-like DNA-binding protein
VTQTRRFYRPDWRRDRSNKHKLHLVGGGREWCAPDFNIERSGFPFFAFEFVRAGRGFVQFGESRFELSVGTAFFFDPKIHHIIRSDPANPLVKYFFNFAGTRIRVLLCDLDLEPGSALQVGEPARMAELLDEAIDHALKATALGLRAATSALEHALVLCSESRRPAGERLDPAFATYLRCRNYLLRHYPVVHSISEAACECHVSNSYMTRLFQRFDSETPYELLRRLKLNEALLKLREPRAQAKVVALDLGYKSAAHFSRAFRQFHGISPGAVLDARSEI